ncbi:MAG: HlyD family efflux transporter periplasmic adaptor subunit, partial [Planctomycetaceae bacterium]|nr:HlyD family efflux transporter periplasmic adaptor subunit [Planctomycetaceae bacterium]
MLRSLVLLCGLLMTSPDMALAQTGTAEAAGAAPTPVTVDREALTLRAPDAYRIPLVLRAKRHVAVSAPANGVLADLFVEAGQSLKAQFELGRLDAQELELQLEHAQALLQVAQAEANAGGTPAAQERIKAAEIAVKLAELRVGHCSLRMPFDGVVTRILAQPGNFVPGGQPILEVVDPSELTVLLPIERDKAKAGDDITLQVENRTMPGKVTAIVPPPAEFEPLRDLFLSLAGALVTVPNPGGQLMVGQSVVSEMIPRHPIAEVPNAAVHNTESGQRRIQVL